MVLRSLRLDLTTGQSTHEVASLTAKCGEGNRSARAATAGTLLSEPRSPIDCFKRLWLPRIPRSSRKSLHDPESRASTGTPKRVR